MKNENIFLSFLLLLLPSVTYGILDFDSGGGVGSEFDWQILTRRNYSSQIRQHSHLLLIVTVPWSGESRTLKKEVSRLVSTGDERLRNLKLMVVHRNSDKLLADVLGATDEIALFYYHNASRFKYQGRLHGRSIVSSVSYLMSFQPEEVPLESLSNEDELKSFMQSTDEAVFLVEFCGWSARLLHPRDGDVLGESPTTGIEPLLFSRMENLKGTVNEKLTCEVENGSPWLEGIFWSDKSTEDNEKQCTLDEFRGYKSFFPKFIEAAREFFIPPESLRFGLISDRSLLPFLGVESSDTWMLIQWISGCENCSKILEVGDDIRTTLQTQYSLGVMELDGDQSNQYPAFSMNKPSIILLIDRSSLSSKVREKSKSSLEMFRRFAQQNQISGQMLRRKDTFMFGGSKKASDVHGPLRTKLPPGQRAVKLTDNSAFMIINDGKRISLDRTFHGTQDSSGYNLLSELLKQKNPGTKLSFLAKEVGFQLLSEDFEEKVVDSLPSNVNIDKPGSKDKGITGDAQNFETLKEADENDFVATDDSVDEATASASKDCKHPENHDVSEHKEIVNEDDGIGKSPEAILDYVDEDSLHLQEVCSTTEVQNSIEEAHSHHADEISSGIHSYEANQNSIIESSGESSSRCDVTTEKCSIGEHNPMDNQLQHVQFTGSYYVSDGGYRLLEALTGSTKIPSVVILDPMSQQHYVLHEESDFCHSSLVNFVTEFLNGSLAPYQRSESVVFNPRDAPVPPFVNLDFHETNSIPRVTVKMLSELILGPRHGYRDCETPHDHSPVCATNKDVLVLFSNSWCGFCMRLELVVREVYRAFQALSNTLNSKHVVMEDIQINVPTIFYIDCMHNDCSSILELLGKEESYPTLLLLPAEKKDVVSYEGDMSVNDVIEFLTTHGTNTNHLSRYKGLLWTKWQQESMRNSGIQATSDITNHEKVVANDEHNSPLDGILIGRENGQHVVSHTLDDFLNEQRQLDVAVGFILSSTAKLLNAPPFDNSSILIVDVEKNVWFQGLIINKRISWEFLKEFNEAHEHIKQSPLFYGGPVIVQNLPLVSLAEKAKEGFSEVYAGLYYGNSYVTRHAIDAIRSGNQSASDYWFFLGFSNWEWNQLFNEIAEGAWDLSPSNYERLKWPEI